MKLEAGDNMRQFGIDPDALDRRWERSTSLEDERRYTKITARMVLASPFYTIGLIALAIGALIDGGH